MSSKKVSVEPAYRCPFCENHHDEEFYSSPLVGKPICAGCPEELFHFSAFDGRPDDSLIPKVEVCTGKSWQECKIILLRRNIGDLQTMLRERPREWLLAIQKELKCGEADAWADIERRIRWYSELLAAAETQLKNVGPTGKSD
ncbi:MAG: hypothetical protein HY611_05400 [Elusimicrobia bacterium]|nr:hypothetical protein [Elusimicrobiota bacterium]